MENLPTPTSSSEPATKGYVDGNRSVIFEEEIINANQIKNKAKLFSGKSFDTIFLPIIQDPNKYGQIFFKIISKNFSSSRQYKIGIYAMDDTYRQSFYNPFSFFDSGGSTSTNSFVIDIHYYNFLIAKLSNYTIITFNFVNRPTYEDYDNPDMFTHDNTKYFYVDNNQYNDTSAKGNFTFQVGATLI